MRHVHFTEEDDVVLEAPLKAGKRARRTAMRKQWLLEDSMHEELALPKALRMSPAKEIANALHMWKLREQDLCFAIYEALHMLPLDVIHIIQTKAQLPVSTYPLLPRIIYRHTS